MGQHEKHPEDQKLEHLLQELAEQIMDRLNADAPEETAAAPAMLTSYVLVLEGNGWTPEGEPISRSTAMSLGSSSQVKGLLVEALDDLRAGDLIQELGQ